MSTELSSVREQSWPWPDSLDAFIAAPDYHTVVLENDSVRVLSTRVMPGQTVPLHTHRWPCLLFIVSWSDLVRRDDHGNVTWDTRQVSEAPKLYTPIWYDPLPPHSIENVGDAEFNAVTVEIKGDIRP